MVSYRCRRLCGALAAEIEGIKLDIVIMQKQMDEKSDRDTDKSSTPGKNGSINCLEHELLSREKEKRMQLEKEISIMNKERIWKSTTSIKPFNPLSIERPMQKMKETHSKQILKIKNQPNQVLKTICGRLLNQNLTKTKNVKLQ